MRRVAVTYRFENKAVPYLDALRSTGIEPVSVTPERPLQSLDGVQGLMLTGGTDLNPVLYGEIRDPRSEDPDDERDKMERLLLVDALDRDLPVLAICRGLQLFNVVHGGTLVQHIDGHSVRSSDPSDPAHTVEVKEGTRLSKITGTGVHDVNSRHHQAMLRVGAGLVVSALANDGVIEGIERADRRFAIAVQWHPENLVSRFPAQRKLFEAFRDSLADGVPIA